MEKPPKYELYDLRNDPWEFENLANVTRHQATLTRLTGVLEQWREQTGDPLLNPKSAAQLKAEIEACFVEGTPEKASLELDYPRYFFSSSAEGQP